MFTSKELEWIKLTAAKAQNEDMDETAADIYRKIVKSQEIQSFKIGDSVRHKKNGWTGSVLKIAQSGLRAYIMWDVKYWDPSYIELRNLELIKEETNHE